MYDKLIHIFSRMHMGIIKYFLCKHITLLLFLVNVPTYMILLSSQVCLVSASTSSVFHKIGTCFNLNSPSMKSGILTIPFHDSCFSIFLEKLSRFILSLISLATFVRV